MIKKILYTYLPLCLLMMGSGGCKDDDVVSPLPETVPLILEASGKSFVMGETLVLTIKVNDKKNPESVANEDFNVHLSAKEGNNDATKTAFKDFPSKVIFPKGESSIEIKVPIADTGIKPKQRMYVDLSVYVRGYTVTNPSHSVVVSDRHYTVMSLKGNSDKVIKEGDSFTIQATLPVKATDNTEITVSVPDAQKDFYETLPPATLTIAKGETTGEVTATTKHNPAHTKDEKLTLEFFTLSDVYPVDNASMEITMKDQEAEKGSKLLDERWVYDSPELPFSSGTRKEGDQDAVIAKYGVAKVIEEGDGHPNADLANAGWKFYNAWEFHKVGKSGDAFSSNTTHETDVPTFFAARNTKGTQSSAGVQTDQFGYIVGDGGYYRMIEMKVPTQGTGPVASTKFDYGTAAIYACGTGTKWKSNSQLIREGCRMEVRARLRGEKKGFNMAIWLLSDEGVNQQDYAEVDILENPAGTKSDNRAFQTFHYGPSASPEKASKTNGGPTINMTEWNIYWMEWRSADEIALGINGEETVCLKRSDAGASWSYTNAQNAKGLKFILTMGAPSKWSLGGSGDDWVAPADWDSGFRNFTNYKQDRDNPAIPAMEIDWVRTYINKDKTTYEGGVDRNTNKFY